MTATLRKFVVLIALVSFAQISFAVDMAFASLIGKWKSERIDDAGVLVVIQLEIRPDQTFSSTVYENDRKAATFEGICELRGKELTWTYLHSSKPLTANKSDTDMILNVDEQQFIYKSKLSGEPGLYNRVQ
ncbi:MAG TPA: hypothetical protein VIV27_02490 [Halioglobus sp.]